MSFKKIQKNSNKVMESLNIQRRQMDNRAYTVGPKKYLGYILLTLEPEVSWFRRIFHLLALTNCVTLLFRLVAFVFLNYGDILERYLAIIYINYYCLSFGKHITIHVYRLKLKSAFDDFKQLSPSLSQIRQYRLQIYCRNYKYAECFICNFFVYMCLLFSFQPFVQSFILLWRKGEFGFVPIMPTWPLIIHSYLGYALNLPIILASSWIIGFSVVSTDVSLLSCISQLCAQYDLIAQRILELKPEREESLEKLKEIIKYHQKVLKLTRKVNSIFGPSIMSTLASSSFIICFVAYLMLDDVSLVEVVKAFLLLIYESKQIILICFYSNKLMDMSGRVFEAVYMHEWYNGSLKYRRHVAFLLMNTRQPISFRVAGITNISLITLQHVFSNAYQIFAVLKTA